MIRVTGRPVRTDTFSNLKHRKEIDLIFNSILISYRKKECKIDFDKILNDFVIRCLEDRRHELAIHSVAQNCDVDALRSLLPTNSGQPGSNANSGMSQLKKMLMGSSGATPSKPTR